MQTVRKAIDSNTKKEEASAKKKRSTGILSRRKVIREKISLYLLFFIFFFELIFISLFPFFKEVDDLIAHAESFVEKAEGVEAEGTTSLKAVLPPMAVGRANQRRGG